MKTLEQIRNHELEKLTRAIVQLTPARVLDNHNHVFIFQCLDANKAGLISRYEAREVLKFNKLPHNFPAFNENA